MDVLLEDRLVCVCEITVDSCLGAEAKMLINASLGAARKMFNSQASGPRGPYSSVIFVTCPLN